MKDPEKILLSQLIKECEFFVKSATFKRNQAKYFISIYDENFVPLNSYSKGFSDGVYKCLEVLYEKKYFNSKT